MVDTLAIVRRSPRRSPSGVSLSPRRQARRRRAHRWSGISTGTERLLFHGRMPAFPGMGYPLVPGYETRRRDRRGRTAIAPSGRAEGFRSRRALLWPCARIVRGAASHLVTAAARIVPVSESLEDNGDLARSRGNGLSRARRR